MRCQFYASNYLRSFSGLIAALLIGRIRGCKIRNQVTSFLFITDTDEAHARSRYYRHRYGSGVRILYC